MLSELHKLSKFIWQKKKSCDYNSWKYFFFYSADGNSGQSHSSTLLQWASIIVSCKNKPNCVWSLYIGGFFEYSLLSLVSSQDLQGCQWTNIYL